MNETKRSPLGQYDLDRFALDGQKIFFTLSEVARMIGSQPRLLRDKIGSGEIDIPVYKITGKDNKRSSSRFGFMIHRDDIKKIIVRR